MRTFEDDVREPPADLLDALRRWAIRRPGWQGTSVYSSLELAAAHFRWLARGGE